MFEFDQYLGFLLFMTVVTIGFWLMILLLTFIIPYWVTGSFFEWLKERKKSNDYVSQQNTNEYCLHFSIQDNISNNELQN